MSMTKKKQSSWQRTVNYVQAPINLNHADVPIILCCLVTGLCDSCSFDAYSVFVSMQTGNSIFLALGASNLALSQSYNWLKSLVSILSFLAGCFAFSNTRHILPKARGTLSFSFLLQSICITVAAALVQSGIVPEPHGLIVPEDKLRFLELLPIGFLAFQFGGQMITSRILGFNEVPTTVFTSVYCDLISDPSLLKSDNVKRNRRLCAIFMIFVGGILGGWIIRSGPGMSLALCVAAAIKLGIAFAWSLWGTTMSIDI